MSYFFVSEQTDKQLARQIDERADDFADGMGNLTEVIEGLTSELLKKDTLTSRQVLEVLAELLDLEDMDSDDYRGLDFTPMSIDDEDED